MVKKKYFLIFVSVLTVSTVVADDVAFFYALEADFQKLKGEGSSVRQPIKIGSRSSKRSLSVSTRFMRLKWDRAQSKLLFPPKQCFRAFDVTVLILSARWEEFPTIYKSENGMLYLQ